MRLLTFDDLISLFFVKVYSAFFRLYFVTVIDTVWTSGYYGENNMT